MNTENKQGVARRETGVCVDEIGEGRYKPPILKEISHGDVKYSIRNMVNNTVITLYGNRWLLDLSW